MKLYLAPLEGITGFVYRNSINKYFKGLEKYFMPFLSPKSFGFLSAREKEELAPENNAGINVVPQILTNDVDDFLATAKQLRERGYTEVNVNLGCPSKPVVNKGRGSGALAQPQQLDSFLEQVFDKCDMDISIKTRIGKDSPEEFTAILDVYNKYPLKELIVHPRVGADIYGNKPNWKVFEDAYKANNVPLCYNGDIFTLKDFESLKTTFPKLSCVMIGRGLISNPFLAEEIMGLSFEKSRFWDFHDDVLENYQRVIPVTMEMTVLFKMKELWRYMMSVFVNGEEWQSKIHKTNSIVDYKKVIEEMKKEQVDENKEGSRRLL